MRRIGLFGGSFNPAHEGHRALSLAALASLRLDEIWWLVAPQNPLKSPREIAPFAERLREAAKIADHPRIRVSDLEARLGTRFTADTLRQIRRRYPGHRFLWLMGADNLVGIDRWKDWADIFRSMPIAVFDRPAYTYPALAAKAARRFGAFRRREQALSALPLADPPAWAFVHHRLNPISATAIRAARRRSAKAART